MQIFRFMLSLLPACFMMLAAIAFFYKTRLLYPFRAWLNSPSGKYYLPAGILLLSALLLTWLAFRFRRKKPELGNQVFSLYILLPILAFIFFSDWTSTVIIILVLASGIALSQRPIFAISAGDVEAKQKIPGVTGLAGMQAVSMIGIVVFGILLLITARDWAYYTEKMQEIRAKNLYAEVRDLRELVDHPEIEYAKITDPAIGFGLTKSKRFGSGSDAYTVMYAQLVATHQPGPPWADWPLWYYCGSRQCDVKKPFFVAIDRCDDGTECPQDFLTVLGMVFREKSGNKPPRFPAGLRLLSDAEDLGMSAGDWSSKSRFRLMLLCLAQLMYTGVYVILAFKLRRFR